MRKASLVLLAGACIAVANAAPASAATHAQLVKDIDPGRFSSLPMGMAGLHGKVFFEVRKPGQQLATELWRSDGSAHGTKLVKTFRQGSRGRGSFFTGLTAVGGKLFFSAFERHHGRELWAAAPAA